MNNDPQSIYADMSGRLQQLNDEVYKQRLSELVPTTWEVIGVHTRQIHMVTKALMRNYPEATIDNILELVDEGFQDQAREQTLCTLAWLTTKQNQFDLWLWPLIDRWAQGIDDWEICDTLATYVAVTVVHKNIDLVDQLVNWARFPNKWRRRFALSIAAALNQRGRVHTIEALRVCHEVMQDPEPIVRKAAAWVLREASEHNQTAVFTFLHGWKKQAHPSIVQDGSTKLTAEQRQKLMG